METEGFSERSTRVYDVAFRMTVMFVATVVSELSQLVCVRACVHSMIVIGMGPRGGGVL